MISSSFLFKRSSIRVDVLVGELLQPVLCAPLLVVAHVPVANELLQVVHAVTTDVADGDLPVLGKVAHHLDELLPPLLGQLGDREPDQLAVVGRCQTEVRLEDRPLDPLQRSGIERLDRQHPRLGDVDRRELLHRRFLTVVVDRDTVEKGGRSTSGSHRVELVLRRLDGLVHAALRIVEQIIDHSVPPRRRDDRANSRSADESLDVPLVVEAEHVDRQPVVHAKRESGRVHDLQPALDRLLVRELGEERRGRVESRVTVVDAIDRVLPHQDGLGPDLERTERSGRIGGEERIAGTAGEDHDSAFLEVANRPPADVRLGDLGDRDRRETRVWANRRSSASWIVSELRTVASMPA